MLGLAVGMAPQYSAEVPARRTASQITPISGRAIGNIATARMR
jgi:hypothetical protein